jgi:hypothetical protein
VFAAMGVGAEMADGGMGEENERESWDLSVMSIRSESGQAMESHPRSLTVYALFQLAQHVHVKGLVPADVYEDLDAAIELQ